MVIEKKYDVIVVGAGHAGVEASLACARLGSLTALITMDPNNVSRMSCNPAIGGLAKGHLVREIDALGGEMGKATDDTSIQSRVLNLSQGPAVWGIRAQCDKHLYSQRMKKTVEEQEGLQLLRAHVKRLLVKDNVVIGVMTDQEEIFSKCVILTTGTFLNGLMHIGENQIEGGRTGEPAAKGLSEHLRELGFAVGRLKTGTNPRVHKSSIDFTKTKEQWGDEKPVPFSYATHEFPKQEQVACFVTYTNLKTHQVIRDNIGRSPLFSGAIQGIGPRYCPSIEDKVVKFPDRDRHQVFLEPEGFTTDEFYLNGLSTSLPVDVQEAYLHTIEGLENAVIARPGYAVEYDYVPPTQLTHDLQTKKIKNLFLAGQINGTSGYEEAAAQGLMAGINAVRAVRGLSPFILSRTEAYIGVLIDDLVTKGTEEPYRMFTSRAEYRLLLRPDNADLRLTHKGFDLGLVPPRDAEALQEKKNKINEGLKALQETRVPAGSAPQEKTGLVLKDRSLFLADVLKRPNVRYPNLREFLPVSCQFEPEIAFQVEVELKYEGYLCRQREEIAQRTRFENIPLPEGFPLATLESISRESREKILRIKPVTIGQASRIPGVTPVDITVLILAVSRYVSGLASEKAEKQ